MQKMMIRKLEMYEHMSEASFTPGAILALGIAFVLYVVYFFIREIPASIIDIIHYSQQTVTNPIEAERVIHDYVTAPETMLVALALTAVLTVIAAVYVGKIEKRPLSTIGLVRERSVGRFSGGYILGLALFAFAALPDILGQTAKLSGFAPLTALFLLAYIIQAVSEEVFFRGYMMSSLTVKTGAIPAVLISSAVFTLLHVLNSSAAGAVIFEVFLSGVLYALVTLRTGSIWAAVGMHAAYSFTYGLTSPVALESLATDYSALKFGGNAGDIYTVAFIALTIAAILLTVFAGENRLAVPQSEERRMYLSARKAAKEALAGVRGDDGVPLNKLALSVSAAVQSEEAKTAALLYVTSLGSAGYAETGYSENVLGTVESLLTPGLSKSPMAHEIKEASVRCRYEMKERYAKYAKNKDQVFCPLLRREIDEPRCSDTAQAVDGGDRQGLFGMMDLGICLKCSRRN